MKQLLINFLYWVILKLDKPKKLTKKKYRRIVEEEWIPDDGRFEAE